MPKACLTSQNTRIQPEQMAQLRVRKRDQEINRDITRERLEKQDRTQNKRLNGHTQKWVLWGREG